MSAFNQHPPGEIVPASGIYHSGKIHAVLKAGKRFPPAKEPWSVTLLSGAVKEEPFALKLTHLPELHEALERVQGRDDEGNYERRNQLVLIAVGIAAARGFQVGVRLDPAEPEWPVVYFELPGVGQVSWHLPQHEKEWDGHTTEEKTARVQRFIALETIQHG